MDNTSKHSLIIGAGTGIGYAITNQFRERGFRCTTVSRTGDTTINGDITDKDFREELYRTMIPDVLVIAAGTLSKDVGKMYETNTVAPGELMIRYYDLMPTGSDIILISSIAAVMSENLVVPEMVEMNAYATSKRAVSDLAGNLSRRRTRDVRVTTVEPNDTRPTRIHSSRFERTPKDFYDHYRFEQPAYIEPEYIAETCLWVIDQPRWVTISRLTIENNFMRGR
jgi:NAD(P)-dependent dehydrogenase (short-subunit alcohol dehydrogenase family)